MGQAQQTRTESVAVSRLHPLEELVRFQVRDDPVCRTAGQAGQPGDLCYSQLRALRRKAAKTATARSRLWILLGGVDLFRLFGLFSLTWSILLSRTPENTSKPLF
jgi:hypothetical protein